jgi:catechol 2,3-dioxygenase-like lactoylglutathione lyase family enzyme
VLQHVTIEVKSAEVDACTAFMGLLGFTRSESPEGLKGIATWLSRNGTQMHLLAVEQPVVPALAHAAVVVDDYDTALALMREHGHEVRESTPYWGTRRAFARMPSGHLVELMETAPPS